MPESVFYMATTMTLRMMTVVMVVDGDGCVKYDPDIDAGSNNDNGAAADPDAGRKDSCVGFSILPIMKTIVLTTRFQLFCTAIFRLSC